MCDFCLDVSDVRAALVFVFQARSFPLSTFPTPVFPTFSLATPSHPLNLLMATAGDLAMWKALGGAVKTAKKAKQFVAPNGEREKRNRERRPSRATFTPLFARPAHRPGCAASWVKRDSEGVGSRLGHPHAGRAPLLAAPHLAVVLLIFFFRNDLSPLPGPPTP